jgi:hypothetical protein
MQLFRRIGILIFTALFVVSTNGVAMYSVYCMCSKKMQTSLFAQKNCCHTPQKTVAATQNKQCNALCTKKCCNEGVKILKLTSKYQLAAAFAKKMVEPAVFYPNLSFKFEKNSAIPVFSYAAPTTNKAPPLPPRRFGRTLRIAVQSFLC